ncbi:hypothetical protein GCM10011575_09870 [Microlunatus endophyticus]|uniref:Preprotein translocase subunit YajC n=1 Tax=Microlunatus endophyticus TaxID=1716077 RepID=A0A917W0H2_9ACTN|nr:preprotein translocase subunit YajC [Microlunatus endophyticus]GGL53479.1 hypothetical protein GCM10011575_09870 [Microlunatus endophyticus]
MGSYGSIILIVVMIIAFWLLIMRPQRKRQAEQAQLINAIEPGSRVVTTTGIYATVVAVGDKQIVLETAPGTQITMLKQAVGRVVREDEEDASLAGYRGGAAPAAHPDGDEPGTDAAPAQPGQESGSASGLAGGAPIQEYAPGPAPDFSAPEGDQQPHETAPWPPYGSSEGSTLGNSSLSGQPFPDSQPYPDKNADDEVEQSTDKTDKNAEGNDSNR